MGCLGLLNWGHPPYIQNQPNGHMELDASSHHPPGAPLPPTSRPVEWLWRYKNRHLHPQNNMIYWFYTRFRVWAFISPNRPSGPRQMPLGPIPLGPWSLLRHQAPSSSYCGSRKPKLSIDLLVLHGGSRSKSPAPSKLLHARLLLVLWPS